MKKSTPGMLPGDARRRADAGPSARLEAAISFCFCFSFVSARKPSLHARRDTKTDTRPHTSTRARTQTKTQETRATFQTVTVGRISAEYSLLRQSKVEQTRLYGHYPASLRQGSGASDKVALKWLSLMKGTQTAIFDNMQQGQTPL